MEKQKTNIQKPLIISYKECRENLINSINKSGLPSFLLETILSELLLEVRNNANAEYENAIKIYENTNTSKEDGKYIVVDPDEVDINK